jgi:uncharacterized Ntn-hydrolase superfamily protein
MTYSIVARDDATGELGVAVAACMFAVGSVVPWARAGVGAVATQALSEATYGPRCLELMADGASAEAALAQVRAADELAALRQVAVIDADGGVASFTGELSIDHAGHQVGDSYGVQANTVASERVWPAMAEEFEASHGTLAERMLAALGAAQREGGDARGQMSAAMVVVDTDRRDEAWAGTRVSIRVDRHAAPLDELAALLDASVAFAAYTQALDALIASRPDESLDLIDGALAILPGEENFEFVRAGALAAMGRTDEAVRALRALVAARPSWAAVARSVTGKGMLALPVDLDPDAILRNL